MQSSGYTNGKFSLIPFTHFHKHVIGIQTLHLRLNRQPEPAKASGLSIGHQKEYPSITFLPKPDKQREVYFQEHTF